MRPQTNRNRSIILKFVSVFLFFTLFTGAKVSCGGSSSSKASTPAGSHSTRIENGIVFLSWPKEDIHRFGFDWAYRYVSVPYFETAYFGMTADGSITGCNKVRISVSDSNYLGINETRSYSDFSADGYSKEVHLFGFKQSATENIVVSGIDNVTGEITGPLSTMNVNIFNWVNRSIAIYVVGSGHSYASHLNTTVKTKMNYVLKQAIVQISSISIYNESIGWDINGNDKLDVDLSLSDMGSEVVAITNQITPIDNLSQMVYIPGGVSIHKPDGSVFDVFGFTYQIGSNDPSYGFIGDKLLTTEDLFSKVLIHEIIHEKVMGGLDDKSSDTWDLDWLMVSPVPSGSLDKWGNRLDVNEWTSIRNAQ